MPAIEPGGTTALLPLKRVGLGEHIDYIIDEKHSFQQYKFRGGIPMFGLGGQELILILLIILLLFGAKKLPELARGLGKGMKEFKKAQTEIEEEFNSAVDDKPKKEKSPSSTQS